MKDEDKTRERLRAAGISRSESYSRKEKLYWRWAREAIRVVAK